MCKNNEKKPLLLFGFIFLVVFFPSLQGFAQFTEDMNGGSGLFIPSDGWTNGAPFNCTWRASQVTFSGGIMSLTMDRDSGSPPYKSGEYRSNNFYKYGLYEVRMKAAKASGIVSSFFTYTGPSDNNPWDEIDIEILGKDTTKMQTNYFTNGTGGHETMVNLGFDASAAFHTYAFEWLPDRINWYVDGNLVLTENGSRGALPVTASKIMMNFWPGTGVDSWLGPFNGNVPLVAQYDWVRFTPQGSSTTAPTATPTSIPTTAPTNPPVGMKGDVNGNGVVDIVDGLLIAQYYVGLNPANFNPALADVNCANGIDIVDALLIAQLYVGLISGFPC